MGITLARIQNLEGADAHWSPYDYHRIQPSQIRFEGKAWRVERQLGVRVMGEPSVRRSPGEPTTLRKVHLLFWQYAKDFWDPALFLAVIANESRGVLVCERWEERLGDYSFGPGQFLTATAYGLIKQSKMTPPDVPVPQGGSAAKWRAYLCEAKNSMPLIRAFLSDINKRFALKQDPVLTYASYNAGSPRPSTSSDWGLITNKPETLDHISAWYGDAWFVINKMNPSTTGVA